MTKGEFSFRYLGVPISTKKLTIMQCQPLIKKIIARIKRWVAKLLSYAGRVQLIKCVPFGVQTFWSQIFLIPKKVIKIILSACRTFLWTDKSGVSRKALMAWEKACLPKSTGGLNIVALDVWNAAAIMKLFWNLAHKKVVLWIRWVHNYYVKGRDINAIAVPKQASWVIKKIISASEYANGNKSMHQQKFKI